MAQITFEISEAEEAALAVAAYSPTEYLKNWAQTRANLSAKEVQEKLVAYCNENSVQMAVGRDAQIMQALELGVVQRASDIVPDMLLGEEPQE
jgi:hypothetical protein